jgi:peptidoglycan hydrolase CwlO-like protein
MEVSAVIGIAVGSLALVTTLVNYVIFQAKLRWEMDQFKNEKKRLWDIIDENQLAIKTLEKNEQEVPRIIEKRLDKLEETMVSMRESMGQLQGEIKVLAMLINKKE